MLLNIRVSSQIIVDVSTIMIINTLMLNLKTDAFMGFTFVSLTEKICHKIASLESEGKKIVIIYL